MTYENRPLAGALVVAMNRLNPSEKLSGPHRQRRSCAVPVAAGAGCGWSKPCTWFRRLPAASAEWASFWASLTFELPTGHVEAK